MNADESPSEVVVAASSDKDGTFDRAIYEDFMAINNELTNLQRELVSRNAELGASEQRYRVLNAELDERVRLRTADLERARHEAEQANRAKSDFLAMMSHEIRTPMNGVIGMIEVLNESPLGSAQREMVDVAHGAARSLLAILDDLLDFAQADAGKLELAIAPMRLAAVVAKGCAARDPVPGCDAVPMSVFVDPHLPDLLMGDEARLRQVVAHLVDNAIKFSGGRGSCGEIEVRALRVAHDDEFVDVEIIVADHGIGISDEMRARLFVPFSQADASITRRHGGTGLGLAVTATLVGLMGGRISVDSVLGEGSTFTVHLRLARSRGHVDARDPKRAGAASSDHQNRRPSPPSRDEAVRARRLILIAEDDETNRMVIAQQMKLVGFAADVAVDGEEALMRWRSGDYALVLTDLHMPVMDGYALAAAIRTEEDVTKRTPIIALTANALRDEEARCLAAGMDAYLTKPCPLPLLKKTLEASFSGS